jgi:hypothetical protein
MFGNIFGKKDDVPKPRHPGLASPLQLRLGAAVRLDPLLSKVLGDGRYVLELPEPGRILSIESQGVVDLGEGVRLHRFYLGDDWWIQVKTSSSVASASDSDAGIDEIHFFGFGDVLTPGSQAQFEELASRIGLPSYSYAGKTYGRLWGEGAGLAATADFQERVYPREEASYGVRHQDMLHSRDIANSSRPEFLLVSVETDDATEVSVVHSVGIALGASDLEVT